MKKNKRTIGEQSLAHHLKMGGKLSVVSKSSLRSLKDLSIVYTPGVAAVSLFLAKNKEKVRDYTMKGNSVAVISDGSAVLGLGNIGPEGALPVMEGKCVLFKTFADIDAVPIVLATQNTEEIIAIVKAIAPGFGGVNLEDISAPRCFEIEERLKQELTIPVMHDDQHGTAIIILAGLLNALKVVKKNISHVKIVVSGAGAAGMAITKILIGEGVKHILVVDRSGIIHKGQAELVKEKRIIAEMTNSHDKRGSLADALEGSDVFIGVSAPDLVTKEMVQTMASKAIVFALANPTPEIMPDVALSGGAFVVATGRSDFPNQLNNAQVFPGVFRGALDNHVTLITDEMKRNVAHVIAGLVSRPNAHNIVPNIFDKRLVKSIARVIRG
ncbi:MAG: NADP-dependent malic enzyme [bacterium]|nr:NADP-dependent malic enzyme [bacterium]